jgi:hypothetical protein
MSAGAAALIRSLTFPGAAARGRAAGQQISAWERKVSRVGNRRSAPVALPSSLRVASACEKINSPNSDIRRAYRAVPGVGYRGPSPRPEPRRLAHTVCKGDGLVGTARVRGAGGAPPLAVL